MIILSTPHFSHWSIPLIQFSLFSLVPRRLFFAAQQRIAITLNPNYYKKCSVSQCEKESRRTWPRCKVSLEKSSKNYSRRENEPNQTSCKRPPPPPAKSNGECFWRVFHVVTQNPPNLLAIVTHHSGPPLLEEKAGWSAVWYKSLTDWWFSAKFKLKMESDPFLFRQDLANSYWWARAHFGMFI